jgi:hypothetical protein
VATRERLNLAAETAETPTMHQDRPSRAERAIMAIGAAMLFGSFLQFAGGASTWSAGWFPVATLLPLYGTALAVQVALARFARMSLPDDLAGFTPDQLQVAVGCMAGLMALAWLATDVGDRQVGLWIEVAGGLALAGAALARRRERRRTRVFG